MEQKLLEAAAGLPCADLTFEVIQAKVMPRKWKPLNRVLKFAIAAVLILSLCISGLAYAKTNYSMWVGPDIVTLGGITRSTGYSLPRTLGGVGFWSARKLYLVYEGTSQLDSLMHPLYTVCEASYGANEKDVDGRYHQKTYYTVHVCKTDDPLWRHFTGFTEDDAWAPANLNADSYDTAEYNGFTLQMGTTTRNHVYWIDTTHNVCIGVSSDVYSLEQLEQIAHQIIDFNS